jgi:NitT/TauT family transport system ATP-binding protein
MNNGELIRFIDVSKVFSDPKTNKVQRALKHLELCIDASRGNATVQIFLGPSGCGKTTALNLIAGLDFPTAGQVLVRGEPVKGPGRDRGFVFQNYSSFPHLTVLENAAFGLKLQRIPKKEREERAMQFISRVHLEDHIHKYPKELSGGMRQRVALARTLAVTPELVLFDEPLGALDAQTKREMYKLVDEVRLETQGTFIYVTHDIQEGLFLGDVIHIFSASPGRILHSVDVPYERPRDLSLLAEPQFNDFLCEVLELVRKASIPVKHETDYNANQTPFNSITLT